ncbi:MAG: PHP domain-containing protein, partial [Acidobacteriota bacterium]
MDKRGRPSDAPRGDGPPSRNLGGPLVGQIVAAGARKERLRQREWRPAAARLAPRPYAELRAASAFSFLDGASLPEDLVEQAGRLGLPAVALVDANGVYGAPRFYKAAQEAGVRALVGAEITLDRARPAAKPDSKKKKSAVGAGVPEEPARLTVLVQSRTGYRNLCRLVTVAASGKKKGEAFATREQVAEHSGGLHVLSGGDEGPVARALAAAGADAAQEELGLWSALFPGRLHVELQRHGLREEEHRNRALVDLARRLRLPLLATNGVRYARPRDKDLHDVFTCIRHHTQLDAAGRRLAAQRGRFLKDARAMAALFPDLPEALDHAWELAGSLDFTLADLGYRFPEYPLPPGESPHSYLRQVTWNGARGRFRPLTARAQAQIEKELAMIEKLDLAGYFLIVWDVV